MGYERECSIDIDSICSKGVHGFTAEDLCHTLGQEDVIRQKSRYIGKWIDVLSLVINILRDHVAGRYKSPMKTVLSLGFAVSYLIMPFDAIPDMIPVVGYLDDIGVLSWAVSSCASAIEEYRAFRGVRQ